MELERVIDILRSGGIGVLPTDTLYGLVARALDKKAVERVYEVRERPEDKSFIILIHDISDLKNIFKIQLSNEVEERLREIWPNKVSVVLPMESGSDFDYLTRGNKSLAFRVPQDDIVREVLKKAGPLIAPSANPSGLKPAINIEDAKNYFGNKVDFYFDGGTLNSLPSTLIAFDNEKIEVLRDGAVNLG